MLIKDFVELRNKVLDVIDSNSDYKEKEVLHLFDTFMCNNFFTINSSNTRSMDTLDRSNPFYVYPNPDDGTPL
mgnify:CR=1 FL=1